MTRVPRLPRSTPEAQGVSSLAIARFVHSLEQRVRHAHSFMLVRHGHVVAEGWWAPFEQHRPHSLFSISKSFTSTAVGFAIEEGLLSLDDTVVSLLPDDVPAAPSEHLAAMRVRHLLTMTTGHATDTVSTLTGREPDWARTILAQPVPLPPGSAFVYDTGATHLLSAILHRLTGERLVDYLRPRLFDPIGIADATWEQSPTGVDAGGWGLSLTTEDVAAFGLTYLDGGRWDGRQVVPAGWVEQATAFQVPNGDFSAGDDWAHGYGFQFWRAQHGAYRADGAFGQLCVMLPEQDAVLVVTGGLTDMQTELDVAWQHLLPVLGARDALPGDPEALDLLSRRLRRLAMPLPEGAASTPTAARVSGRRYSLPRNSAGLSAVTLTAAADSTTLTIDDEHGSHVVEAGFDDWRSGASRLLAEREEPIAAAGVWADDDAYLATILQVETPFALTISLDFRGDEVTVTIEQNVSFGPTRLLHTIGRA